MYVYDFMSGSVTQPHGKAQNMQNKHSINNIYIDTVFIACINYNTKQQVKQHFHLVLCKEKVKNKAISVTGHGGL